MFADRFKYCYLTRITLILFLCTDIWCCYLTLVILSIKNSNVIWIICVVSNNIMLILINDWSVIFDPKIGPWQALTVQVRLDPVVIAMKGYCTFPRAPGLEPHHQMQFTAIPWTLARSVSPLYRGTVGVFYSHTDKVVVFLEGNVLL